MPATPSPWTDSLSLVQGTLFFVLLFVGAASDLMHGKVRNLPCAIGVAAGLLLSCARGGLEGAPVSLASSALAAGAAFLVFFLFYWMGGLGAGDVKLMAAAGALAADWRFVLWLVFHTAFAGVPLAIGYMLWQGNLRQGLRGGVRSLFRWRYDRGTAEAPQPAAGEEGKPPGRPAPRFVPYAVAILLGGLWTVWTYIDRGMALPFL